MPGYCFIIIREPGIILETRTFVQHAFVIAIPVHYPYIETAVSIGSAGDFAPV